MTLKRLSCIQRLLRGRRAETQRSPRSIALLVLLPVLSLAWNSASASERLVPANRWYHWKDMGLHASAIKPRQRWPTI